MSIHSISHRFTSSFLENIWRPLSPQDKAIIILASAILACLAIVYMVQNWMDQKEQEYKAKYKARLYNGSGQVMTPEGDMIEGEFKKGRLNGKGKVTMHTGQVWEGTFKNNKMHGQGTISDLDGNVIKKGKFIDGNFKTSTPSNKDKSKLN